MGRRRHLPRLRAWLLVSLAALSARAAAPAPARPSLASALATIKPPAGGVVTVEAAQCPLPSGEMLPSPDAPVQAVAGVFHRIARTFGAVTAIAPPTMILLNTWPVNPDIYDGMPTQDALKLLAASLTPGQWQQLTGDREIELPDMVSETQSSLFTATLPRKLVLVPQPLMGADESAVTSAPATRDLTASLPQVRLRLRRLDLLDSPALRVAVPLAGVKTVGALLARVGRPTCLELYADRRWEGRALTVLGTPPSAPPAAILRWLAFCLTGAYRRVGPAYVLTDDVLSLGARRAVLPEFAAASAMRQKAPYAAGDSMAGMHSRTDLPLAPDSMTFTLLGLMRRCSLRRGSPRCRRA